MLAPTPNTTIAQYADAKHSLIEIAGEPHILKATPFTSELDMYIHQALKEHEVEQMARVGIQDTEAYTITNIQGAIIGAVAFRVFWGALHIKYLFVAKEHRQKGIGRMLIEYATNRAKLEHCPFVLVETMNYQALHFYEKLGFELEFTREGFENNVAFHYLRKSLS